MQQRVDAAAVEASGEKAQLHSDEYKPPREELVGSVNKHRVRATHGLHEVEYRDMVDGTGEMAANEAAAPEMLASKSLPVETGTSE